jgi:peptidoglycan/LPS O-acetylase OafA/YrhL
MRLGRVDTLKACAIVGVLLLHSVPARWLERGSGWWIAQAVPIFVVLLGYNATRMRLGAGYWGRRLRRIYVPFLAVFLVSFMIEPSAKALSGLVTGVLPTDGPGNYFVTLVFQFVVAAPALLWLYRRNAAWFLGGCLAISFLWDLAAIDSSYVYGAALPKWLALIGLGMALATDALPRWWPIGLAVSVAYLLVVTASPDFSFGPVGWGRAGETALGAFYTVALVKLALARLPIAATALGRASYHVFLCQIVYFWLVPDRDVGHAALGVATCCAIGLVFWRVDEELEGLRRAREPSEPVPDAA